MFFQVKDGFVAYLDHLSWTSDAHLVWNIKSYQSSPVSTQLPTTPNAYTYFINKHFTLHHEKNKQFLYFMKKCRYIPVLNNAMSFKRANSFSSMAILVMALTYSWTLQIVVVTCRTLCADNFSCWTEVCKWLTIVLRMLDKFIVFEHCAMPRIKRSDQEFLTRATCES